MTDMTGDPAGYTLSGACEAHPSLDRLTGIGMINGDATGTVTYQAVDAGRFHVLTGDPDVDGYDNRFTEITGRLRSPAAMCWPPTTVSRVARRGGLIYTTAR